MATSRCSSASIATLTRPRPPCAWGRRMQNRPPLDVAEPRDQEAVASGSGSEPPARVLSPGAWSSRPSVDLESSARAFTRSASRTWSRPRGEAFRGCDGGQASLRIAAMFRQMLGDQCLHQRVLVLGQRRLAPARSGPAA